MKRWLLAAVLIWSGPSAPAMAGNGFEVDPQTQQRLGVETSAAVQMHHTAEAEGSGSTVDLAPLLTLDAELVAAEAALSASSANYERTAALHADQDNASTLALEAARAQMLGDRARRDASLRQLRLIGGDGLAAMDPAARQALFDRLSRGSAVLLRADFSPGTPLPTSSGVRIIGIDEQEAALGARVLGRTPGANPLRPGPGLLLLVEPADWLQPGRSVRVLAPTSATPRTGVLVPASAVLHRESALWCYVRHAEDRFERRRLADVVTVPGGLFVVGDIHDGELIVVRGAASLLTAELAGANPTAAGDSDD